MVTDVQSGDSSIAASAILCVKTTSYERGALFVASRTSYYAKVGAHPCDILVVVPNRNAKTLVDRILGDSSPCAIRTFDELTQDILRRDDVCKSLGRTARVMLPVEEKFLLEDMKVSGLKVQRLREMLKFFYKGITEGADSDPHWFISSEETLVYNYLLDHLRECKAILACERGNLARKALDVPGVAACFAAPYVIAYGFTSLDLCSQQLLRVLATRQFVAIGTPFDEGVSQIAFAHPNGLQELAEQGATVVDLDAETCGSVTNISASGTQMTIADSIRTALALHAEHSDPLVPGRADASWQVSAGAVLHETPERLPVAIFTTPADEQAGIAQAAAEVFGSSDIPDQIIVGVPNAAYAHVIVSILRDRGIEAIEMLAPSFAKGDPRNADSCGAQRFLSALTLVADPEDMVAWRSWLGFGDWLLRSDAWDVLRNIAKEQHTDLLGAIGLVRRSLLANTPIQLGEGAYAVLKMAGPMHEADELLATCAHLTGSELLAELQTRTGYHLSRQELDLLHGCDGSAASLARTLRTATADPVADINSPVLVMPLAECRYVTTRHLLLCGMVDGYMPSYQACDDNETHDKRGRRAQADRRSLLCTLGCASGSVMLSGFAEADAELADRSRVDIGRIFVRKGSRLATAKPSCLLWECAQGAI